MKQQQRHRYVTDTATFSGAVYLVVTLCVIGLFMVYGCPAKGAAAAVQHFHIMSPEAEEEEEFRAALVVQEPSKNTYTYGFQTAKKKAAIVYKKMQQRREAANNNSNNTTFYCGCTFGGDDNNNNPEDKTFDAASCGYVPRNNDNIRAHRIEWEHVVPASRMGEGRDCWSPDAETRETLFPIECKKGVSARECCRKVDPQFKQMEADLHNLRPTIGELNADRSNLPFGSVPMEPREYGMCDFEIGFTMLHRPYPRPDWNLGYLAIEEDFLGGQENDVHGATRKVVEPPDHVKGAIARTYLYMEDTYDMKLSYMEKLFADMWNLIDPPSRANNHECERNDQIELIQGRRNRFIDERFSETMGCP